MSPKRIQLRRTRGWRKPEGAISVARPAKWGNPWRALPTADGWSVFFGPLEIWLERVGIVSRDEAVAECVDLYRLGIERWAKDDYGDFDDLARGAIDELRGHDLACWCPLEDADGHRPPCHADVLLELANPEVSFPWSKPAHQPVGYDPDDIRFDPIER